MLIATEETASVVLARRRRHTRSAAPSTIAATARGPPPAASRAGPCGPSTARCGCVILLAVDRRSPTSPHHLAGPQPGNHRRGSASRSRLQARRHGENALDLLRAQHWRQLLRLLDVAGLGRQIAGDAACCRSRKRTQGHDRIAVPDARTALDEMQLKIAAPRRALPYRASVRARRRTACNCRRGCAACAG